MSKLLDQFIGKKVFIRTITHYFVGEMVETDNLFICLKKASWIAETAKWSETVAKGELNEVEPYPPELPAYVAIAALIDIFEWTHELPVESGMFPLSKD
jgi:hypothetical protein